MSGCAGTKDPKQWVHGCFFSQCREDKVSVTDSYYYDDGCESCGNDTFSREPFIVRLAAPQTGEIDGGVGWSVPPSPRTPRAEELKTMWG